jgi:hypothetical protein
MSGRGVAMKCSAAISWRVERQWPGRLTVSASRIIPYPDAGGASRAELLKYTSHSVPQKTCNEMMLAEAICCPPSPAVSPCRVCSNGITVDGALPVFEDPYSSNYFTSTHLVAVAIALASLAIALFVARHPHYRCHRFFCPCHRPLCCTPSSLPSPSLLPPLPLPS